MRSNHSDEMRRKEQRHKLFQLKFLREIALPHQ